MAKGDLIGHKVCPTCDEQAEVREDKNENPYLFCKHCTTQVFTHGGAKGAAMIRTMRRVGQDTPQAATPATPPAADKPGFWESMTGIRA